jgi:phospholipid-binding lipoprotein MlaA
MRGVPIHSGTGDSAQIARFSAAVSPTTVALALRHHTGFGADFVAGRGAGQVTRFKLHSSACAAPARVVDLRKFTSIGRQALRLHFGIRWKGLSFVFASLLAAGCSTTSGTSSSTAALLNLPPMPAVSSATPAGDSVGVHVPAPTVAAMPAETRAQLDRAPRAHIPALLASASAAPFAPMTFESVTSRPPGPPVIVAAASDVPPGTVVAQAPSPGAAPASPADLEPQEYDPWEPFNEKMFAFNYNFDRYLLKPAAKGYNVVMPDELQRMIGNAFDNINPVPKWVNNLLQQNYKGFWTEMGRFLINSTLGIGGLWDIARQEFGLQKTNVDFGQTLGKWGVGPGPFLVLPFLPPLTVRDGIGYGVDGAMDPLSYVLPFIWDRLGMRIGDTINDRSLNLDLFQGFEETTIDMYSAVRNGYLQRRYNLIHGDR